MEHGIELDREVRTIHELTKLDHLTECHFVARIEARHLNELIVRFVGKIEDFAVDIDAVNEPTEIQKIQDFERGLDFAKVKNNSGS